MTLFYEKTINQFLVLKPANNVSLKFFYDKSLSIASFKTDLGLTPIDCPTT